MVEFFGKQIADNVEMTHHYNILIVLRVFPKDLFDLSSPNTQVSGCLINFGFLHILKDGMKGL